MKFKVGDEIEHSMHPNVKLEIDDIIVENGIDKYKVKTDRGTSKLRAHTVDTYYKLRADTDLFDMDYDIVYTQEKSEYKDYSKEELDRLWEITMNTAKGN